ncbi:MAG: hypothetical protein ACRDXX_18250 [Stackebrandtia sp.]
MRDNARRVAVGFAAAAAAVAISTPAYAYAHDRVASPWLHTLLDVLTLAVVTSPLWTTYLWGSARRRGLLALVALVQIPAAVFAFVPIADPALHAVALTLGLTITATSLWHVRRAAKLEATEAVAAES